MENCATEMSERVEPLRVAAVGEAENLGHAAMQLVSVIHTKIFKFALYSRLKIYMTANIKIRNINTIFLR